MRYFQSTRPLVLLAEPDEMLRESIRLSLTNAGYECHTACDARSLCWAMQTFSADLVIADAGIICQNLDFIIRSAQQNPADSAFLVSVTYDGVNRMLDLMKSGITEYLIKPFQPTELLERVERLIRIPHHARAIAEKRIVHLKHRFGTLTQILSIQIGHMR